MFNITFLFSEIFTLNLIFFNLITIIFIILYSYGLFTHSHILSAKRIDLEKTSSYECGFNPYIQTRTNFDFKFYIISIIFLVFDLEIIMLLPIGLLITLNLTAGTMIILTYIFLFILILGLIIETKANLF